MSPISLHKRTGMRNRVLLFVVLLLIVCNEILAFPEKNLPSVPSYPYGNIVFPNADELSRTYTHASPSAAFADTPTPTPRPLSFSEMNALYGPCATVPTVMYHHIQNLDQAKRQGHFGLAVGPEYFEKHLEFLNAHEYTAITMQDLIAFFDHGTSLPKKPILLTFDDGYDDFYTNAYPLLQKYNIHATLFLPTGLAQNPGYLTWQQILDMAASGYVYVANHTFSHRSLQAAHDVIVQEISSAQAMLSRFSLNGAYVFAYPYGTVSGDAQRYLATNGYTLAFSTNPGRILCRQRRWDLPRVRVGNGGLPEYGF